MNRADFSVDLTSRTQPLHHAWEHTVGSGHAPLALRADWQDQLRRCHRELGMARVRFHGILCDDMGTLVDERDQLLYSFFNIDRIWDFLLSIGMSPVVELSFMPRALASGDATVFHYAGNVTPPKDYGQWAVLIRKLVEHAVDRYGIDALEPWLFEVWNEPNLEAFWTGTQADYFNLYRHTARAIKGVDERLRVGGPATAKDAWIENFVDFCEREKVPADFISTHHYPTDALGTEDQDTEAMLSQIPRSILREQAIDTQRKTGGRPLVYTEWSSSSNPRDPLHDEPYAATYAVKTMLEGAFVEGYSFWTFSDIFEENYFPSVPFHGGFGLLNLYGVAKPVYRAFQLLHELGNQSYLVDGMHPTLDAWVVRGDENVTVLLNNHALPRHSIDTVTAHVTLTHSSQPRETSLRRIDDAHANPKRLWREMGEPKYLSPAIVEELDQASEIKAEPLDTKYENQTITFDVDVPPHGIAAVAIVFTDHAS